MASHIHKLTSYLKTFYKDHYYSFKIFSRFWLVKTTRIIHHNQLLFTKFGNNLRHVESMTSKVQPTENYWTDDVKSATRCRLLNRWPRKPGDKVVLEFFKWLLLPLTKNLSRTSIIQVKALKNRRNSGCWLVTSRSDDWPRFISSLYCALITLINFMFCLGEGLGSSSAGWELSMPSWCFSRTCRWHHTHWSKGRDKSTSIKWLKLFLLPLWTWCLSLTGFTLNI